MTNLDSILGLADQCVKCGLCLPQCPTYNLALDENESPRGRISLIQALAGEQLAANYSLISHLDHCLQCRRCERVCPSQVKYSAILSSAFKQIPALKKRTSIAGKTGLYFLESMQRLTVLKLLLRFYEVSGLQLFVRASGILNFFKLKQVEQRLPRVTKSRTQPGKTQQLSQQVALFTGCSQTVFDSEVINAAVTLLNALDIDVVIPAQQNCCGALHHLQNMDATELVNRNIASFEKLTADTVLYLSTGCGAFINEHYETPVSFVEITDFLQQVTINKLSFKPLEKLIAVHMPCSQKNVLQQPDSSSALLANIPGIKLVSFEQQGCCGAGGTTMLKYPEIADEIRQPLLDEVTRQNCELVVTTNPGCQLHIQHGFDSQNSAIKVMHPVSLLAQQLEG